MMLPSLVDELSKVLTTEWAQRWTAIKSPIGEDRPW
jgi:hypothetical protein